jgi:uncharacterized phage protein (TIGR02218 family)
MRPCSTVLAAYLAASDTFIVTDLYTFALATGEVLRYSGWTTVLQIPGTLFPASSLNYNALDYTSFALGPRFGRSTVATRIGVAPTELDIEIFAGTEDAIGSVSFADAVRLGLFDGATVELDRLFAPPAPDAAGGLDTSLGALVWFTGRIAECDAGRSSIRIKVKSLMNLLAMQQMPRRLYQAACTHVFGDAMCGFDRNLLAQTASALAGSTQSEIHTALSPSPATLFDQGTIIGLSGANAGLTRTIRQMIGGVAYQLKAWLYPVAAGDNFRFLPGCDHTVLACENAFDNLAHYGGFPYIPPPETAV